MAADQPDRESKAFQVELVTDPDERARVEARNGLLQFDKVLEMVDYWVDPERPFKLRPSALLTLNRIALQGINSFAGLFRPSGVEIGGSIHTPPGAHLVPELVEEMCDYVNSNWERTPIHLSSYILWRLNWIHPFTDGNGRTARALSYLVLCVRLGYRLPGTPTIPEQIAQNKKPYYKALEAADKVLADENRIDLTGMENLLSSHLAKQLVAVLEKVGANPGAQ